MWYATSLFLMSYRLTVCLPDRSSSLTTCNRVSYHSHVTTKSVLYVPLTPTYHTSVILAILCQREGESQCQWPQGWYEETAKAQDVPQIARFKQMLLLSSNGVRKTCFKSYKQYWKTDGSGRIKMERTPQVVAGHAGALTRNER